MVFTPARTLPAVLALGLISAVALSGCSATSTSTEKGSGTGTITVWAHSGQDSEIAAYQSIVKKFNASKSGVTVKLTLIPEADYTKTIQSTPASKLPDVYEMDGPTMASFVYDKKLAAISKIVASKTVDNAVSSIVDQGTYDGKLYGLGQFESGLVLYGNKTLLDKAGVSVPSTEGDAWTADQFESALTALSTSDPGGKSIDLQEQGGFAGEWGIYGIGPFIWSGGGDVLKNNTASGALDSAKSIAAVTEWAKWKSVTDPNSDGEAFTGGRTGLALSGHWAYPGYSKALGSNLVVMPLPNLGDGTKTGHGSWQWGVSSSSDNTAADGKFLDYLLSDVSVKAITDANGAIPGTKSALASSTLFADGGALHLMAVNLTKSCAAGDVTSSCVAVTRPVTAGYPVVTSNVGSALQAIWNGGDPATELKKAAKAIDSDFADNDGYKN